MRLLLCLAVSGCAASLLLLAFATVPYVEHRTEFAALRQNLQTTQQSLERSVRRRAEELGDVDWATFNADQATHAGKRVRLRNADFRHGTLVVRESCLLELAEDIEFAPNADHGFTVRRPEQNAAYPLRSGFQLGFFAAIAVVGRRVVLDGRHHTLKQHPLHAALQRFYAHVELASSAFIAGEGPVPFGPQLDSASDIVIADVRFGRSAHFAVAGNGNRNVELRNLLVEDYEIAAFKLNGVHDAWVHNVTATGHFRRVPINGEFSQTTFLLHLMGRVLGRNEAHDAAYRRLRALHDQATHDIGANGAIDAAAHAEAHALFASKSGIQTGGTVYGFVVTDLGAAVGPVQMEHTPDTASRRVLIENVRVNGTHSHTVEFVSLVDQDGEFVHGPVGELLDLSRIAKQYGSLTADPLASAVLRYVRLYNNDLTAAERREGGRPNVPAALLDWAFTTGGPVDASLWALAEAQGWTISCNTDAMGHVNKGLMVARVQSSETVYLRNVDLGDAIASGPAAFAGAKPWFGVDVDPASYTGLAGDGGHPMQPPMVGYHGNDAHALAVASSYDVQWENVRVGRIESTHGAAVGLEQFEPVE